MTMDEAGDLLPGMNVDGVITLEEAMMFLRSGRCPDERQPGLY